MKTLTVRQPWAGMIAAGAKRIENRSWPMAHRGLLAIHAAKTRDADPAIFHRYAVTGIPPVFGAIIAIVELVDCVRVEQLPPDLAGDPHAIGPWCWILANARPVTPIPCRGRLGIWDGPDSVH